MFVLSTQRPEEGCCPEGVGPRKRCCAGRTISPRQRSPLNPARASTVTELVPGAFAFTQPCGPAQRRSHLPTRQRHIANLR